MKCKKCKIEFQNSNFNPTNFLVGKSFSTTANKIRYFCDSCWAIMEEEKSETELQKRFENCTNKIKNIFQVCVKCSSCGFEAISDVQDFPFTCGNCGKVSMQFAADTKSLTEKRNKLSRQIATLKKASLN